MSKGHPVIGLCSLEPAVQFLASAGSCAMQCSVVQCSAMQCSAVQCSAVQCSAMQCSAVQCSAVQCRAVQCSAVQFLASGGSCAIPGFVSSNGSREGSGRLGLYPLATKLSW
jgi:hypothetical protein